MRALFLGGGYLITIGLYIFFCLLPYYIAYSIIEPESFFGVVGVFILGSVIVPLAIWVITIIVGTIGLSFSALTERKFGQEYQEIKTINMVSSKKTSKAIYTLGILLAISVCIIIYLIIIQQKSYENNSYHEDTSVNDATSDVAIEAANEVKQSRDYVGSEGEQQYYNDNELEPDSYNDDAVNQTEQLNGEQPDFQTLGSSHLNLKIWLNQENEGRTFDMTFTNRKRPELNTSGNCSFVYDPTWATERYSTLIKKQLKIDANYVCDNGMNAEVAHFVDQDKKMIITLSATDNPDRVFYSGGMEPLL